MFASLRQSYEPLMSDALLHHSTTDKPGIYTATGITADGVCELELEHAPMLVRGTDALSKYKVLSIGRAELCRGIFNISKENSPACSESTHV